MHSAEIRSRFLSFFKELGHTIVPSSGLVPADDPTLLFSNAGMNQFKEMFLGRETRSYMRAVSSQKCMRVSGKHNDLEQVGYTPRHHTFFEMLGNFSFGDYFKKETIRFSWELLTGARSDGCFELSGDALWATVFEDDEDSYRVWTREVGLPAERVLRLGEKDNFWSMGETGPCGPCSEIHHSDPARIERSCTQKNCAPGCECGRFLELWNLVFIQYDRQDGGKLAALKRTGVDTGMGLERIASIVQNVRSNYETDLFTPILDQTRAVARNCGRWRPGSHPDEDFWLRVIADHVRAMTFLMAEGVSPSNEGRGYVLRRIMRRAIRHGRHLGIERPFLCDLSATVIEVMKPAYEDLVSHAEAISEMARREEERFAETVAVGLQRAEALAHELNASKKSEFPGREAFKLYDTFGLPLDMIRDVVAEYKLRLDEASFHRALEEQRARSRSRMKETAACEGAVVERLGLQRSEFVGYEKTELEDARVLALLRGEDRVEELRSGERGQVLLERTPFYAESGGQVGDTGFLTTSAGVAEVTDTQAPVPGLHLHAVRVRQGCLRDGDTVQARVDRPRREALARSHTSTHLVHAALRDLVGTHVKQAGSLVRPDRLRFDFSHYLALSDEILRQVEDQINDIIRQDPPVRTYILPLDEALRRGALAFFGDKYGEQVRVVEIAGYSTELCGGTHVSSCGELGLAKINLERSVSAGTRRVEALCGDEALRRFQSQTGVLEALGEALGVEPERMLESVRRLQQNARTLQRQVESLRLELAEGMVSGGGEPVRHVRGFKVLVREVSGLDRAAMRTLTDRLKQRLGSGIVVLGQKEGEAASLLVAVTRDLSSRLSAGAIIRELAPIVGGRGGGRHELAEAGGKLGGELDRALAEVDQIIEKVAGG
ncbi:MAG: alanine--tRNA ligase [Acidobacteriota bacterium]